MQAKASVAEASIKAHTSARTGIPVADLDVIGLQRVAVPWAERVGWYGVPVSEVVSLARVIVDADPDELARSISCCTCARART